MTFSGHDDSTINIVLGLLLLLLLLTTKNWEIIHVSKKCGLKCGFKSMKVLPFSVISYYCSTLNHNQPQWLIPIADERVGVQIKL